MAYLCLVMVLSSFVLTLALAFPGQRTSVTTEAIDVDTRASDDTIMIEVAESEIEVFISELSKVKNLFNIERKMMGDGQFLTTHTQDDSHNSMLSGILNQIHHGHVTLSNASSWLAQIRDGISHGTVTESDFKDFMKNLSKYGVSSNMFMGCCIFG